jgi:3',5'-cyclic AMP phosphodiesterase CpdA
MFTIYQLSDLHFGKALISTEHNIKKEFRSHDERIWVILKTHLLNRIKNNQDRYMVVITGDLSQLGHIDSYNLAKSLIYKNVNSDISKEYGLQLEEEHLFIVPGNHDSYDRSYVKKNNLRTFNNIFFPSIESGDIYPTLKNIEVNGNNYIFMGIDSTYKKSFAAPRKKFGKGSVPKTQLAQLTGRLKEIGDNNVRILCLHHCPIIVDGKRDRSLMLDRSQDLLSWITKNNIDILMCGHLHEDFYDILPLRKLISFLPSKRGFLRKKMKSYKETQLNEYQPISIKGKKARYIDSIAYHYIKAKYGGLLDPDKNEFGSIANFNDYLHNRPEYKEFVIDFSEFDKRETGILMAGTACQEKSRNNSYLEVNIDDDNDHITILRHKYNKTKKEFTTKERVLKFKYNV